MKINLNSNDPVKFYLDKDGNFDWHKFNQWDRDRIYHMLYMKMQKRVELKVKNED